jgi:hypothetical protein
MSETDQNADETQSIGRVRRLILALPELPTFNASPPVWFFLGTAWGGMLVGYGMTGLSLDVVLWVHIILAAVFQIGGSISR